MARDITEKWQDHRSINSPKRWRKALYLIVLVCSCSSCSVVRQVDQFPADTYTVPYTLFSSGANDGETSPRRVKASLELVDSTLHIEPEMVGLPALHLKLTELKDMRFYRRTFDIDVLTIPFKIRPSVQEFPTQLNPNFSATLYLGRRIDIYHIKPRPKTKKRIEISGVGFGYGGIIGIGAVTMNPFVTQNTITYEYDGFVLTAGAAAIYDAKKFNLGLAVGSDFLMDNNRSAWIYQKKPWLGLLFGINLN